MGLRSAAGYIFVIGFLKVFVCVQSGSYCSTVITEANAQNTVDMCVATNGSINMTAGSYVYLDTTGSPTYSTVMCSCEIELNGAATMDVKYRTANTSDCGLRFQLKNKEWGCFNRGKDHKDTLQVNGYSNLTFFRSNGNAQHVYACMGLKIVDKDPQLRCYRWESYTPPEMTTATTTTAAQTPTTTTSTSTTTTTTPSTTTTTTPTPTKTTTTTTQPTTTTSTTQPTTTTSTTTPAPTTTTTSSTSTTAAGATNTSTAESATPTESSGSSSQTAHGSTIGGQAGSTSSQSTPRVAAVKETTNTAAIAGGVVGGLLALIVIIIIIVCLICLLRRRREKRKKEILFGPRTVRYNSNASAGDVQITENALYDSENPSTAMNQLFIGGIPETPGSRDSELPRIEVPDGGPRYAEVGAVNGAKPKVRGEPNRKGSSGSETELKLNNEYSEIDTGISNPGYDSNYKAPYTMPYDNKLGVGTGEKAESVISSPYDYIDNEKLEREEKEGKAPKNDYVRLISNPNDQQEGAGGPGSRIGSESGPGSRLGSESGPGSRLGSKSGPGTPGSRLGSESGPGSRLGSESGPGSRIGSASGYANDPSPGYANAKPGFDDDAHFGYDQV